MAGPEPVSQRNLDGYGAPMVEWDRVRSAMFDNLTQAPGTGGPDRHSAWLSTINPDGSPHVTGIGVAVLPEAWYFTSGRAAVKARNLARDPRCVISVATHPFDLVVEGRAEPVRDAEQLQRVVEWYNAGGWPARVEGDALTAEFSAPSAGPPPWYVYRLVPSRVYAVGAAEPYGAARFDLAG
jgi:hypothetical protein